MKSIRNLGSRFWRHSIVAVSALLVATLLALLIGLPVELKSDNQAAKHHVQTLRRRKSKAGEAGDVARQASATTPRELAPPGKYEKIELADGTDIKVEKWGQTFPGYNFRQPLNADDWSLPERAGMADQGVETLVDYSSGGADVEAIRIDPKHNKMYWIDSMGNGHQGRLYRADLNGKNVKSLLEGLHRPRGLALDLLNSKIYWSESRSDDPANSGVRRTDFEGKNVEVVVRGLNGPEGIAVDGTQGKLFYSSQSSSGDPRRRKRILTSRLDGTGEAIFLEGTVGWSMVYSATEKKLYWAPPARDTIYASRTDAPQQETVLNIGPDETAPGGVHHDNFGSIFAMDYHAGQKKVYWASRGGGDIRRANCDNSQIEILAVGAGTIRGLALDVEKGDIYWSECIMVHGNLHVRIRRIKIPAILEPVEMPAPPLVTSIEPARALAGNKIVLRGIGLADTMRVAFCDTSAGRQIEATFSVRSATEVEAVVPKLSDDCGTVVIAVRTPQGVTPTLPRNIHHFIWGTMARRGKWDFDRLHAERPQLICWLDRLVRVDNLERMVGVVEFGAHARRSARGGTVLFLKNGSLDSARMSPRNVLYHEPFAVIAGQGRLGEDVQLIAVPAIRESFVDRMFEYVGTQ